jgi:hypothetical protein
MSKLTVRSRVGDTALERTGKHGDLVVEWRAGPQKFVNLIGNRSPSPPLHERIEQQPSQRSVHNTN